ncbi:MAG: ABC transporter ATP-binding protein [Pseudomonadota bacterium]
MRELSKCYWIGTVPFPALNNVNLDIYNGEFTVLAGRSGSGKSTLLNIIGALESADKGEVIVDNKNILQMNADERTRFRLQTIGFVFQAYNLIQVLTAQENIAYVCQLQGKSKKESLEIASHWLEEVGLGELGGRRPDQLSGGQQQRVAVARALATNPKIVLADEPTANLDTVTAQKLVCLLQQLNDRFDTTFLISSHDPDVKNASSRLIKLADGHVVKRWDENPPPTTPLTSSCPMRNIPLRQRLRKLFQRDRPQN